MHNIIRFCVSPGVLAGTNYGIETSGIDKPRELRHNSYTIACKFFYDLRTETVLTEIFLFFFSFAPFFTQLKQ